jgi:hypothetical protein
MGGRKPSAPTVITPSPVSPTVFRAVIPEEDYARMADYTKKLETEGQQMRLANVGPEFQQRMAEQQKAEQERYKAALPTSLSQQRLG